VVEHTFALLHQFRRLAVRWERCLNIHDGLVGLACALICWFRLINWTTQKSCQGLSLRRPDSRIWRVAESPPVRLPTQHSDALEPLPAPSGTD
jgi:hypothetical protein